MKKNSTKSTFSTIEKIVFKGTDDEYTKPQRNYFIRCYHSLEALKPMLADAKEYAYVLHDRDNKEPHAHVIVCFKDAKTPSAVCKVLHRLDKTQGAYVDVLGNRYDAFDYMLHRDENSVMARKFRYSASDVYSSDISRFDRIGDNESRGDKNAEFVADLLDNKPSYREMAMKYGRDYIKNADSYHRFEERVAFEEDVVSKHNRLARMSLNFEAERISNAVYSHIVRNPRFDINTIRNIVHEQLKQIVDGTNTEQIIKEIENAQNQD